MKINLHRVNRGIHFRVEDELGHQCDMDGAASTLLGEGNALSPMQLVLAGAAGCSAIDIVTILHKQRQELVDIEISAEATRADAVPAVFKEIHLCFRLIGDVDAKKAERAVKLAVEKYCSVLTMLESTAAITHSHEIVPQ